MYGSSGAAPGKSSGLWGVLGCTAWPTCQVRPDVGAGPGGAVESVVVAMGGAGDGRCCAMNVVINRHCGALRLR